MGGETRWCQGAFYTFAVGLCAKNTMAECCLALTIDLEMPTTRLREIPIIPMQCRGIRNEERSEPQDLFATASVTSDAKVSPRRKKPYEMIFS